MHSTSREISSSKLNPARGGGVMMTMGMAASFLYLPSILGLFTKPPVNSSFFNCGSNQKHFGLFSLQFSVRLVEFWQKQIDFGCDFSVIMSQERKAMAMDFLGVEKGDGVKKEEKQEPSANNGVNQGNGDGNSKPSVATTQTKPSTAELTIFYGGMVNVYDDVPADKAQAIMLLADGGSSLVSSVVKSPDAVQANTPLISTPKTSLSLQTARGAGDLLTPITTTASGPGQNPTQTHEMHTLRKIQTAGDLPIARKHSLQCFLEKRKDRIGLKSPYALPTSNTKSEGVDEQKGPSQAQCLSPSLPSRATGCCNESSRETEASSSPVPTHIA